MLPRYLDSSHSGVLLSSLLPLRICQPHLEAQLAANIPRSLVLSSPLPFTRGCHGVGQACRHTQF